MIRLGKLFDSPAKVTQRRKGATFLIEQINPDDPPLLVAAVFAAQFIHPPFNAAVQTEIVSVNREDFQCRDCPVKPVGKFDLDTHHATVSRRLFDNAPPVQQTKPLPDPNIAGSNIGGNAYAGEALQCTPQKVIPMLTGVTVGRHEEVI